MGDQEELEPLPDDEPLAVEPPAVDPLPDDDPVVVDPLVVELEPELDAGFDEAARESVR